MPLLYRDQTLTAVVIAALRARLQSEDFVKVQRSRSNSFAISFSRVDSLLRTCERILINTGVPYTALQVVKDKKPPVDDLVFRFAASRRSSKGAEPVAGANTGSLYNLKSFGRKRPA